MIKLITIPNDVDSTLDADRRRLVGWAQKNCWECIGYNDSQDHIDQITRIARKKGPISVIDCDCHGTPTLFDSTAIGIAKNWGQMLSNINGISEQTEIYLDACNTGLISDSGGPVAQSVANGSRCTVYGSCGYLKGTFAENNEECDASPDHLPPFTNARDAARRDVWIAFQPEAAQKRVRLKKTSTLNINRIEFEYRDLADMIDNVMKGVTIEFPALRIAPDATFTYQLDNDVRILQVYANGGLLRDKRSGATWRVDQHQSLRTAVLDFLTM